MKRTSLLAVLASLAAIAVFTTAAEAYYHPTLGRFLTRDPGAGEATRVGAARPAPGGRFIHRDSLSAVPTRVGAAGPAVAGRFVRRNSVGQYADGMNLYQYVKSNPMVYTDSSGLAVDPGKDCGLWSRSKKKDFIGPIKKPGHFWLNSDSGDLWDFGPNLKWLQDRYGNQEFGDCTIFKYCRGETNYDGDKYLNAVGDVNKRPKLQLIGQLWFGSGKRTSCRCASCSDIKSCLSEVRRKWNGTRYDHFARHCGSFVLDAAAWCCLWGV